MSIDPKQLDAIGRPIIVASHMRSGTHLTIDLLRRHFAETNPKLRPLETLHHLYVDMDSFNPGHHNPMTTDEALRLLTRNPRPIIKTHTLPDVTLCKPEFRPIVERIYERAQIISVVRDGRSVMLSLKRFEMPWNAEARGSFSEFMRTQWEGLVRPAYWDKHVRAWQKSSNSFTIRYDHIVKNTKDALRELGAFLGMSPSMREPLLPPAMKSRYDGWFRRLIGNTETTNIPGERPGPGEPRTWQEQFSPEDRAYFDSLAGNLLIELGYEPDHTWASAEPGADAP